MPPVWVRRLAVASVLLVAAVAAIVSYCHMQELAENAGEGWRSRIIPLSVDGMLVAATLAIVYRRRHGLPAGAVPWLAVGLGISASLLANVAAARPDGVARIIAAWPPLALAISIEVLVQVLAVAAEVSPGVTSAVPNETSAASDVCSPFGIDRTAAANATEVSKNLSSAGADSSERPDDLKPQRQKKPRTTATAKSNAERQRAYRERKRGLEAATA